MNNFWTVLIHTFLTKLKSKAFLIMTSLLIIVSLIALNIDTIKKMFPEREKESILVIDEKTNYYKQFKKKTEHLNNYNFISFKEGEERAKTEVLNDEAIGLLILQEDASNNPKAKFYASQISEVFIHEEIESILQEIHKDTVVKQFGLNEEDLALMEKPIDFTANSLAKGAKTNEEANEARLITYVLTLVLYIAILVYGNMIATDVATEKASRVMEIVVSSVSPISHMFGKIAGVLLLSITQFILLAVITLYSLSTKATASSQLIIHSAVGNSFSTSIIFYALLFFVLGYILYATLAAVLGSIVTRVEDVSMLMIPLVFLLVIAFFIATYGLVSPSAKIITIVSYIPFFTPIIMFLRISMLDISIWSIILSILIMIATIILLGLVGARIYRGGVLLYSGANHFKKIFQILHLTKKEN